MPLTAVITTRALAQGAATSIMLKNCASQLWKQNLGSEGPWLSCSMLMHTDHHHTWCLSTAGALTNCV